MKKRSAWVALLMLVMLLLYGCGSGGSTGSAKSDVAAERGTASSVAPAAEGAKDSGGQSYSSSAPKETASNQSSVTSAIDRKIIQNAQLEVKIKEADDAVSAVGQTVRAAGGYVQENRVEGTREAGRRVQMTVRVPAGAYGSILDMVAGLGEVTNRREWINDVTEEYLDLDARIKTKETHLEQLRKLYAQGGSIKELMELEQEIARVTSELESMKGRFTYLSNQVAYSTISVSLLEPGVPTTSKPTQNVGERMRNGFLFSWNAMIDFGENVLVFVVSSIPQLLLLAVAGLIAWAVYRNVKRRQGGGGGGSSGTGGGGSTGSAAS